jgi:hypothetical protein
MYHTNIRVCSSENVFRRTGIERRYWIMKSTDFWVVTLCSSGKSRCFRWIYCLLFQGRRVSQARSQQKQVASSDASLLHGLFSDSADGGDIFLRNCVFSPIYMKVYLSHRHEDFQYNKKLSCFWTWSRKITIFLSWVMLIVSLCLHFLLIFWTAWIHWTSIYKEEQFALELHSAVKAFIDKITLLIISSDRKQESSPFATLEQIIVSLENF